MKVYRKEKWNSLTDLKEAIEKAGKEKIQSFNGFEIVTDTHIYGLAFGKVCVIVIKDT